jgi:AraC family transcriptional regulator of adaptative response / DNA-3-methyladenine glycosylase II
VERGVRAVQSKEARFDGSFFTAVLTTWDLLLAGLPGRLAQVGEHALLPERRGGRVGRVPGVQTVPPDASPGSPEWNERADLVARAMRLIADGVIDREGVPGLAARLGYRTRQIER